MMDKNNVQDWLNALINKELSSEEKQELNNLLETNKDFLEEFAFLYKAKKAGQLEERDKWKAYYKQQQKNRGIRLWTIGLAAGFALLLAAIFLLTRGESFSNEEEIYAHFSETAPPSFSVRSDEESALLQKAETAFEAQDWAVAADNYQAYAESLPESATNRRSLAKLYQGISLRNLETREQIASAILQDSLAFERRRVRSNHSLIEKGPVEILQGSLGISSDVWSKYTSNENRPVMIPQFSLGARARRVRRKHTLIENGPVIVPQFSLGASRWLLSQHTLIENAPFEILQDSLVFKRSPDDALAFSLHTLMKGRSVEIHEDSLMLKHRQVWKQYALIEGGPVEIPQDSLVFKRRRVWGQHALSENGESNDIPQDRLVFEPLPGALDYAIQFLIKQDPIKIFQQLQSIPEYEERADWHLALSYLKANDIAACLSLLDKIIADERHDFHSKAKEMKAAVLDLN